MKFFLLIICISFSSSSHLIAQPGQHISDSLVVIKLINQADFLFDKQEYDSALFISGRAADIAKEKKMTRLEGWAFAATAKILIDQNQLIKGEQAAQLVNKIGNQLNDSLLIGVSLLRLAQARVYNNKVDEAILLFDKSITSGLGNSPNQYLALAFNDLGQAWGLKDEYDRQAGFLHKALDIFGKIKDDAGIAMALGNLSSVYYQLGQKEKAIDYAKQSLKYREKTGDIALLSLTCCNLSQYYLGINIDEAIKYQELCVKYARQSGEEGRIIHSYITSSLIANGKKNNKEAFEYEQKVIALLEKSKSDQRMLAHRYIAAAFYTDILKLDSAVTLDYYDKSIRLSTELGDRNNLKDVYLYLSNYYNQKKNYGEAFTNYKKYILYRDSLINIDKEQKIAELESRYEINKKDNEITRLNSEQKIKQLEIEKQKAIIAGNTANALQKQNEIDLLSKSKELQEIKIKQQNESLEKQMLLAKTSAQQLQLSEQDKELKGKQLINQKRIRNLLLGGLVLLLLLGAISFNRYQLKKKLEKQTELLAMRNSISQDLHDDIGASLSNINILNELARRNITAPEKSKEYLSKASEDIQRISESLSDIVWNINPKYDAPESLFIRMKRYAADMFDGKNIDGQFDFPEQDINIAMTMTQRRDMYLVFKEAINNLVKYSEAEKALVKVATDGKSVSMFIKDDGKGFDRAAVKTGNGLQNMEQRTAAMGGNIIIKSAPGSGTSIKWDMKIA